MKKLAAVLSISLTMTGCWMPGGGQLVVHSPAAAARATVPLG